MHHTTQQMKRKKRYVIQRCNQSVILVEVSADVIPIFVIFMIGQRYFMEGLTSAEEKG